MVELENVFILHKLILKDLLAGPKLAFLTYQSGIHVCYAGYIWHEDQNSWRCADAWHKVKNSSLSEADPGVAEGCSTLRRKFLV